MGQSVKLPPGVRPSRGFVKEFQRLVKWTSDFRCQLIHTEINSSTLKEWHFQLNYGAKRPRRIILNFSKNCCMFVGWVFSIIHSSTLILTYLWSSNVMSTKSLPSKYKSRKRWPFRCLVVNYKFPIQWRLLPNVWIQDGEFPSHCLAFMKWQWTLTPFF